MSGQSKNHFARSFMEMFNFARREEIYKESNRGME